MKTLDYIANNLMQEHHEITTLPIYNWFMLPSDSLKQYKKILPEVIYYMTLYHLFKDEITDWEINEKTGFKNTIIWNKLYKFQQDGVLGALHKIDQYGGCIIADSVGLGKTFEALAIIKYYELRNERVLVLCPKKLRDNWNTYVQNDRRNILLNDRFNYDILHHTDLSRTSGKSGNINLKTINWGNYDLVVIDESHNFRNNNPSTSHMTRYSRLMHDIIQSGVKTKVLMLSATPVNNRLTDIKNQFALITEGNDKALAEFGIDSIDNILRKSQETFNQWSKLNDPLRTTEKFMDMMDKNYFQLLDMLTLARSRKHIEKYYNVNDIGKFPTRLAPISVKVSIDTDDKLTSLEDINKQIKKLNMAMYSPINYILPSKKAKYSKKYDTQFKQADREQALVGLMRVGLLKRMESSINSFAITVGRMLDKINDLLNKITFGMTEFNSDLSIDTADFDEPEIEDLVVGKKVKVLLQDMDLIKWKQSLEDDQAKLQYLHNEVNQIHAERDAKLENLKARIMTKVNNPINPNNRKVIIFTAFADTAYYLYKNIAAWAQNSLGLYTAIVTGSGSNKTTMPNVIASDINEVLTQFSPCSKERGEVVSDEIDILIATDCISEGQNLQDCDYLINYDIHWNPVRIIQRFGRIDRLGSKNNCIQLVNYWPNMELDEYINLESRVTGRMVLLNTSATGEDDVISNSSSMNDLDYRKKQLQRLQHDVLNLEDLSEGISITDISTSSFKHELAEYLKAHRDEVENLPFGVYSEISGGDTTGIICTWRQVDKLDLGIKNNPFFPYYIVYISDDGVVHDLSSTKLLDTLKILCTSEQFNMLETTTDEYTSLLDKSVASIIKNHEQSVIKSIFSGGGAYLNKKLGLTAQDFILINFLVIK
ncbi:MAG: hypothetical protein BEN18_05465 [Epulopiscium sp. Nuni2H_MBin001]|nr:MAG: hypothetical protein BEN18_05465 [Epulopiscium sp. Nuni2H_MBin001]